MRTLPILLCSFLVLAPAQGQQVVQRTAPDFYVSYGIRNVPLAPVEESSSSDAHNDYPDSVAASLPGAPTPRQYPIPRGGHRRYRPGYAAYPQLRGSAAEEITVGVVVTLCLAAALFGGDR